ncbi:hypothetical protein LTR65_008649 [Meristemomyces frigidus]
MPRVALLYPSALPPPDYQRRLRHPSSAEAKQASVLSVHTSPPPRGISPPERPGSAPADNCPATAATDTKQEQRKIQHAYRAHGEDVRAKLAGCVRGRRRRRNGSTYGEDLEAG